MAESISQNPFDAESLIVLSLQNGGVEDPGSVDLAKLFRIGKSVEFVLTAVRDSSEESASTAVSSYNALLGEAQSTVGTLTDELDSFCHELPGTASRAEAQIALAMLDSYLSGVLVTDLAHQNSGRLQARLTKEAPAIAEALGVTPQTTADATSTARNDLEIAQLTPGYL